MASTGDEQKQSRRPQQDELSELIDEALRQPGVREVVEVYSQWKDAEDVARPYRELSRVRTVVSASSRSAPA